MTERIGLYLHVPFCARKCGYCDFYSLPYREEAADAYVAAVLRALEAQPFGALRADTVYFGGGTPSLLGQRRLAALLDGIAQQLHLDNGAEITLEANPGTVSEQALFDLRRAGCNRLSFGVQSLDDGELAALGRLHDAAEAVAALEGAHRAGFAHLSADLMLGIPRQSEESLRRSIDALARLPVDHVSAYLLKIEPDTPFGRNPPPEVDDDALAERYLLCVAMLEAAGLAQYEISSFAKAGGMSRHNLKYWRCEPYLGLGPAAHSFLHGRRFAFPRDLDAFLAAPRPFDLTVADGEGGGPAEQVMLRLRLREGLDTAMLERMDADPAPLLQAARTLERHGLCAVRGGTVALTPQGFLVSNAVIARLCDSL